MFITIDYPGALKTYLWGINDSGDITGMWVPQSAEAGSGHVAAAR
jgi:hypothetical protein